MAIFQDVLFYISPTLLPRQKDDATNMLVDHGASPAKLKNATHIISNTDVREKHASKDAPIITVCPINIRLFPYSIYAASLGVAFGGTKVDVSVNRFPFMVLYVTEILPQGPSSMLLVRSICSVVSWHVQQMWAGLPNYFMTADLHLALCQRCGSDQLCYRCSRWSVARGYYTRRNTSVHKCIS